MTKRVEESRMGLRTRVRLPPGPLDGVLAEPQLKKCEITLYENVFGVRFFSDEDSIRTKSLTKALAVKLMLFYF